MLVAAVLVAQTQVQEYLTGELLRLVAVGPGLLLKLLEQQGFPERLIRVAAAAVVVLHKP
jgi:hypothetical protein